MIITDTVLSAELTLEHNIHARHLPEEIRDTPLVWVQIINEENDNISWILQSRQYIEKMKPEYGWKPALGLYELLYLKVMNIKSITWSNGYVKDYKRLWDDLVINAMETYRLLVGEREEQPELPTRAWSPGRLDYGISNGSTVDTGHRE